MSTESTFGRVGVPQRVVVALAAATHFVVGMLMGTSLGFTIGANGGSDLAVGLVSTAYFVGLMCFAPVWGAIADVTGRRKAVLVGTSAAATLAIAPLVVVRDPWLSIGVRALYATFAAGFMPIMLAVSSERGGGSGRGRALGFFNSARAVGLSGGQFAAGVLLGLLLPSALFAVVVGFSLLSTVTAVFVETRGGPSGSAGRVDIETVTAEVRRRLLPAVDDRTHLRRHGLRWLYVALALRNATVLGVLALMPVYLPDHLGLSEFEMGALLALNPAGQVVFMYVFGRIADDSGRKGLVVVGMAGSAVFALVAAAAAVPASPDARLAVAAAAFVLIAASFSAMTTGALAFIGDVAPTGRESELMGLRSTAKGVGGVVGPALVGVLAGAFGYEAAFVAASLLACAATALVAGLLGESRPVARRDASVGGD
ncbi:MFS transporter [Salinigranum marinum]|uniref:MFS transporter n=1 Tax=Salinigranum marinum TaxID=1515595 RepID=UPI002989B335|nr:MFS transporter [Salinigranum marinum]